jgi:hypothetical protein
MDRGILVTMGSVKRWHCDRNMILRCGCHCEDVQLGNTVVAVDSAAFWLIQFVFLVYFFDDRIVRMEIVNRGMG